MILYRIIPFGFMKSGRPFLLFLVYILLVMVLSKVIYQAAQETHDPGKAQELILSPSDYPETNSISLLEELRQRVYIQPFNLVALVIFILAVAHTFFAHQATVLSSWILERNEKKFGVRQETFATEGLRFLGEVEVIFGFWVVPLLIAMTAFYNWPTTIEYLNQRDYAEPMFVVMIMVLASTKPILQAAESLLRSFAKLMGESVQSWWWSILTIGPILGSLITEPGAMTISALLLSKQFYRYKPRPIFAYATLGLLFTNISVGGVLTSFAAPPVLMVSKSWGWDTGYMLFNFGPKAILGIFLGNLVYFFLFQKDFKQLENNRLANQFNEKDEKIVPFWISIIHVAFLAWIVVHSHYPVVAVGSFLLFLGFYQATLSYQSELSLRSPMLVGFFLAGLIIHGTLQAWWISPIIEKTSEGVLFLVATVLTAFNDNAEITFLASLTPTFPDEMKYMVVAGAVTGGGLTVIANAPNPAGQSILGKHFNQGISALQLFMGAFIPTVIIGFCFYFIKY